MKKQPTDTEILDWLATAKKLVEAYKKLDAACDAAIKAGCMDVNGPLHEAIWEAHQLSIEAVDVESFLSWFIYDNDCGKNGMQASSGLNKPLVEIKSFEDFERFMMEWEVKV
jgi:hypothetical protein